VGLEWQQPTPKTVLEAGESTVAAASPQSAVTWVTGLEGENAWVQRLQLQCLDAWRTKPLCSCPQYPHCNNALLCFKSRGRPKPQKSKRTASAVLLPWLLMATHSTNSTNSGGGPICPERSWVVALSQQAIGPTAFFETNADLTFSGNCTSALRNYNVGSNVTGCESLEACSFTCNPDGDDGACCLGAEGDTWTPGWCMGKSMFAGQPTEYTTTCDSGHEGCSVQVTFPHVSGDPSSDAAQGVTASAFFSCYKTHWDDVHKYNCCAGIVDDALTCDPTWCPSDPQGACGPVLAQACKGPSLIGLHKFLTLDPLATNGVKCADWYSNITDGIQACALLQTLSDREACFAEYADSEALVHAEVQRYCDNEGRFTGECACIVAAVNCSDTQGPTYDSAECLLGQHVHGSLGQSTVRRVDIYCSPSAAGPDNGGSMYAAKDGGICSASCDPATAPDPTACWPPAVNRNVGTTGGPGSIDALVPALVDDSGGVLGAGDSGDTVGALPTHCWLPACQHDVAVVFKDLVQLHTPCPPMCAQFSAGNTIDVGWSDDKWSEMGYNFLSCQFPGAQGSLATPFVFTAECLALTLALPANYTATVPLTFSNISSESHATFKTIPFSIYSSLNARVFVDPSSHTGSLASGESASFDLLVDTSNLVAGQSWNGFVTVQATNGSSGQAYLPLQLAILPDGAAPELPTTCSPSATAAAQPTPQPQPPQMHAHAQAYPRNGAAQQRQRNMPLQLQVALPPTHPAASARAANDSLGGEGRPLARSTTSSSWTFALTRFAVLVLLVWGVWLLVSRMRSRARGNAAHG
jgi:hypothetical protein